MSAAPTSSDPPLKPFAWDGVGFVIPGGWELAIYQCKRQAVRVEFEDDVSLRMTAAWAKGAAPADRRRLEKQYDRATDRTRHDALATRRLGDLPPGFSASLYDMPQDTRLITAIYRSPADDLLGHFALHFAPDHHEDPAALFARIASSLQVDRGPVRSWRLYDIDLAVPRRFNLLNTSFGPGNKLMVFTHQGRRLYLWWISLADRILQSREGPAAWAVEFLNRTRLLKGPRFEVDPYGQPAARRRPKYLLGHYDEITRWCKRYDVQLLHLEPQNQLILTVYNFRKQTDLEQINVSDMVGGRKVR